MGFEELLNFASNNLFAIFVAAYLLYDKTKNGTEQIKATQNYIETMGDLKNSIESMQKTNESLYNLVSLALFERNPNAEVPAPKEVDTE